MTIEGRLVSSQSVTRRNRSGAEGDPLDKAVVVCSPLTSRGRVSSFPGHIIRRSRAASPTAVLGRAAPVFRAFYWGRPARIISACPIKSQVAVLLVGV